MRSLSSTLEAAQKAASHVPFVKVTVNDLIAGVPNLRWERLYSGSESDRYHATVMPADGSLLRARVDPIGSKLRYQRVVDPDENSSYFSWQELESAADAGVALVASGAHVALIYVAAGGTAIHTRESFDSGANFEPAQVAASGLGTVRWLAAALKGNGDLFLVYNVGTTVSTLRRTNGSWGAPAAWPYSANDISGLAAALAGDFHLVIAGKDTSNVAKLWTATYGDGFAQAVDTWSALRELEKADAGSNVGFTAPFLAVLDTHRLFFIETFTGAVAYSRPLWTWFSPSLVFAANAWREPVPFDHTSTFGLAITGSATTAWLSTPSRVWRAPRATPELDLSVDVLEVRTSTRRSGGRARVTLRNDDGRYNDLPGGAYAIIRHGAELAISPGYVTSSGQEVSAGPRYWIDGWQYTSSGGEATLVLFASDAWSLVDHWRARRQYTWAAGSDNVFQILRFVFGRAGIELVNIGASATAVNHRPAFTIHPAQQLPLEEEVREATERRRRQGLEEPPPPTLTSLAGLRAVRRLLAMIPDIILVSGPFAFLFELQPAAAPDYAYGTDHPIFRARYADPALPSNRVQAFGDAAMAERFDFDDIDDQLDRLRQVHDLNLTSAALAGDRAEATLRQEELSLEQGELLVPVNCVQELQDVVEVHDPLVGLVAAKYRVVGLDLTYVRRDRPPAYEQRILLGRR